MQFLQPPPLLPAPITQLSTHLSIQNQRAVQAPQHWLPTRRATPSLLQAGPMQGHYPLPISINNRIKMQSSGNSNNGVAKSPPTAGNPGLTSATPLPSFLPSSSQIPLPNLQARHKHAQTWTLSAHFIDSIPSRDLIQSWLQTRWPHSHCRPVLLANQTQCTPPAKQFVNLMPSVASEFMTRLGTNTSSTRSSIPFTSW